jgi:hypothetical protein
MAGPVEVMKSPADKKDYRFLKLGNGMSVLLIHDPEIAAAMAAGGGNEVCTYLRRSCFASVCPTYHRPDVCVHSCNAPPPPTLEPPSPRPPQGDAEMNGSDCGSGSGSGSDSMDGSDEDEDEGESEDEGEDEDEGESMSEGSDEEDEGEDEEGEDVEGGARGRGKKKGAAQAPAASKRAAAAMAVGVGSFSDPAGLQGLSHYLEHMLFMGSEKFPDENDYDAFLSKHGGSSNAYTELVRRARWAVGGCWLQLDL